MFIITFKQVATLLLYIMLGYVLCRRGIIPKETSKIFSKLLIFVFTPAYTIPTLAKQISMEYIVKYIVIFIGGALVAVGAIFLGKLISKFFAQSVFEKNLYDYLFAFANLGYFGYPLIKGVYGEETLANFMLFSMPITIMINSYGYYILTADDTSAKVPFTDSLKRIFNIPLISSLIGISLGLLPVSVPQTLFDALAPAGNCYSVSAMLAAGVALSAYSVKQLFSTPKPYFAGIARLIVIPAIIGGVSFGLYKLLDFDFTIVIFALTFSCLPAGMNVVVFPEAVGKDGSLGAKSCFISYIMALVTIPVWFYIMSLMA